MPNYVVICKTLFKDNTAEREGGALSLAVDVNTDTISNDQTNQTVPAAVLITGSLLLHNVARQAGGGGIAFMGLLPHYMSRSNHLQLLNTTLQANRVVFQGSSVSCGGGVLLGGPSTAASMEAVSFIDNFANNGAAICAMNAAYITIISVNLTSNTAQTSGGGIYANGTSLLVLDSKFANNSATDMGGAVFLSDGMVAAFVNGTDLQNNNRARSGNAIATLQSMTSCVRTAPTTQPTTSVSDTNGSLPLTWAALNHVKEQRCYPLILHNVPLFSPTTKASEIRDALIWVGDLNATPLWIECSGHGNMDRSSDKELADLIHSSSAFPTHNTDSVSRVRESLAKCQRIGQQEGDGLSVLELQPAKLQLFIANELLAVADDTVISLYPGGSFQAHVDLVDEAGRRVTGHAPATAWLSLAPGNLSQLSPHPVSPAMSNGSAIWSSVDVQGWTGTGYTLSVSVHFLGEESVQVPPASYQVRMLPCHLGHIMVNGSGVEGATRCIECPRLQYSLWVDPRTSSDLNTIHSYMQSKHLVYGSSHGTCMACPDYMTCPGGALVAPIRGFWASAPNSTLCHRCINPTACSPDDTTLSVELQKVSSDYQRDHPDDVNGPLLACQKAWYASSPAVVISNYLNTIASMNTTTVDLANLTSTHNNAIMSGYCLLWGVPHEDALGVTYMQRMCSPGYAGRLCATCVQGNYLTADYECKPCQSAVSTAFLWLAVFFATVGLISYTAWTTFNEDFSKTNTEVLASEKLKVLITHIQYMVIITRLNLGWPVLISRFQAAVGSMTGSMVLGYSASCLFPNHQSSADQALVHIVAGIVTPCAAAALVMVVWCFRYMYFHQALLRRSSVRRHHIVLDMNADRGTAPETPQMPAGMPETCMSKALHALQGHILSSFIPKVASPNVAIVDMDTRLSLPRQLLVVLLVAVFILYPSLVQVSLSMFACHLLDNGQGPYGELQTATWKYGYWILDFNQECYTGVHSSLYLPLGVLCVVVFCIMPPLAILVIITYNHKQKRMKDLQTKMVMGFLYSRYRPRWFFWEVVMQLEVLSLVVVDVFARTMHEYQQALLLLSMLTVIALVNMSCNPLHARLLTLMEFCSLMILTLTITLGLFFVDMGNSELNLHNAAADTAVGVIIIMLNVSLILAFVGLILAKTMHQVMTVPTVQKILDWMGKFMMWMEVEVNDASTDDGKIDEGNHDQDKDVAVRVRFVVKRDQ